MSFETHTDQHACGTLPVRTYSVLVTYCEHHQAWSVTWSAIQQEGEDVDLVECGYTNLGPFDTKADALAFATDHLTAMLS